MIHLQLGKWDHREFKQRRAIRSLCLSPLCWSVRFCLPAHPKTFLVCRLWFAGNDVPVSQTKQHLWVWDREQMALELRITEFQQNSICCVRGIRFCWVNVNSPSLPDTQLCSLVVCFVVCRLFLRQRRNPRIPGRVWSGDSGPSPAEVVLAPFTLPLVQWVTVASGALGEWCNPIPGVKVEPWMKKFLHFFGNPSCPCQHGWTFSKW